MARLQRSGPVSAPSSPSGTKTYDYTGYTVFPGIVGMHNHLYYSASIEEQAGDTGKIDPPGFMITEVPFTAPRLYLATGVTTMRTTGSVEPYTDLRVRQLIDRQEMPGPQLDVTAPYLEGQGTFIAQLQELTGPDDAKRTVAYWAEEGATSYKAYMFITRAELGAAIQEAHARKLKLTGHLCSVTWREAIELGIDDLEHGPVFHRHGIRAEEEGGRMPAAAKQRVGEQEISGPEVQDLIKDLVSHHVAVTSTLPVFEASVPGRPPLQQRSVGRDVGECARQLPGAACADYLRRTHNGGRCSRRRWTLKSAFVKAGGLLLAGPDPTRQRRRAAGLWRSARD